MLALKAAVACVALLAIAASLLCAPSEPLSFTIRPALAMDAIEVRYFLTGAFGGYGSFAKATPDGGYRIPLLVEGQPARSLKAIVYVPGCDFNLVSVDLSWRDRSAAVGCEALPMVTLRGRIVPPPQARGPLEIQIVYQAHWAHQFLGYGDGPVQTFLAGTGPLDSEGRFRIEVPDFTAGRFAQGAALRIVIRETRTGNIVEWVAPADGFGDPLGDLKIRAEYPAEIQLHPGAR